MTSRIIPRGRHNNKPPQKKEFKEGENGLCLECKKNVILLKNGSCYACDYAGRKKAYKKGLIEKIDDKNVMKYYEFMSNEELYNEYLKGRDINTFLSIFKQRSNEVCEKLELNTSDFFTYASNQYYNVNNTLTYYLIGIEFFGVKDNLRPLDDYLKEIEKSKEYKKYLKSKK